MGGIAVAAFALLMTLSLLAQVGGSTDPYPMSMASLKNASINSNESLYKYATDLTRNILPKPLHSHNDYWRDVPFYSALSVGAVSVEADVWLINDTLYVGHELSALTEARTFQALYVQPILRTLQRMNPTTPFVSGESTRNGVFDMDSSQTLYLWIDVKTDGPRTFAAVIKELEPLRTAGFLTSVTEQSTGTEITNGPVTVIGTGNTPLNRVQGVLPRDYFFDAPLHQLSTTFSNITRFVTPIASVDFPSVFDDVPPNGTLNDEQLSRLQQQVEHARSKGIGARYWDTPAFPVSTRNTVWQTLCNAGVALINVDDLIAGAGFAESGNYW